MDKLETIYIILYNKDDYNTNFQNKDTWKKNMKRFVHDFLETHKESQIYKKFILVPKYLIDAPFEIPTLNTSSYFEEEYCIKTGITDNLDEYIEDINHYTVSTKGFSKYDKDCNDECICDEEVDDEEADDEETDDEEVDDEEADDEETEKETCVIGYPSQICVGIILSVYFATALSMILACTFSNDNKILHTEF